MKDKAIAFGVGVVVGCLFVVLMGYDWGDSKEENRASILNLFRQVAVSESEKNVLARLAEKKNERERLVYQKGKSLQIIAPQEFFGNNWVLNLCFKGGTLEGYRIGVEDDLDSVPDGAPAPAGKC